MPMTLIEQVFELCTRLSDAGWDRFFLNFSDLKIRQHSAAALANELARDLNIDRGAVPDFAAEGTRAIEPGRPALSFLCHALASPLIGASEVDDFPTADDLEIVENYVYGVRPPSVQELRERCNG